MAILKRFIHFKKFSDFNSKKLSANEANTQYTVGVSGELQNGEPDVLYQSYCWIKDTQQQWTHGQLYNGSMVDLSQYLTADEIEELYATYEDLNNKQDRLVSGTNIKTVNGTSILGSGNIEIESGEANVQSDWLENDYTSDAYIRNKTHNFEGLTITKAGNYSVTTNNNRVYFAGTKRIYYLDVGVRTQILSGPPIYVTLYNSGVLTVEDSAGYLGTFPLVSISSITPLDDAFIPEHIVRGSNLKTINGESIVGSGNIEISGGNGGSSAYSEVNHGTADTTFTLTPNTFHVWDEVTSLTLDFGSETSGVANEFLFQFTSGATATSLTLPDDIKWANDSAPTIAENMIYQISVLKGLASCLEFSNEAQLIDNHATIGTGGVIDFAYPVASDLTISFYGRTTGMPTNMSATISSGEQSVSTGAATILYINSITPKSDNIYNYTHDE